MPTSYRMVTTAMSLSKHFFVVALIAMMQSDCSLSLPITSKPLEANPDHLTWDTSYHQADGHEARKIPKSIFIAPSISYSTCAPGYTLNPIDNKCHKEKIQLNQQSLLIQQALGVFPHDKLQNGNPSDIGLVEYDYDDDSLDANAEKYDVPLTLSFGSDLTPAAASTSTTASKLTDALQSSPFRNNGDVTPTNSHNRRTTDNLHTTQPMGQSTVAPIVATTETGVARDAIVAGPDNSPAIGLTTTDSPIEISTVIPPATTEDFFVNTIPTTTNDEEDRIGNEALVQQNRLAVAQLVEQLNTAKNATTSTTTESSDEELSKDLQDESLFRDDTVPETTTSVPSTTTFEPTTIFPTLPTQSTEATRFKDSTGTTTESTTQTADDDRVVVVSPETSTLPMDSVIAATELLNKESGIESEATKRQRQTVLNHELNEDERVSIDQLNRFVYTHLTTSPTDSPPAPISTTTIAPRTNPPTRESLRERLNRFHRLSEENRKRLKATHRISLSSEMFANRRPGSPPSAAVRFTESATPTGTRSKPLFTWLPPGWSFDQTGGRPSIKAKPGLSFWNEMPLIRDPALSGGVESTDRAARANSRSPTEHLFRQEQERGEVSDQEEHDVMAGQSSPEMHKMVVATRNNARYQNR